MDQLETQPIDENEIPKLDDNDMFPGKILAQHMKDEKLLGKANGANQSEGR